MSKETGLITLLVVFLVGTVLWVFGTLPWVVINFFLCTPVDPSVACAHPETYGQYARQILATDAVILICAGFAIAHLRRLRRLRQP